ncbi:MAG: YtxH domain-containing protein [Bacillota bacterium]|nr:YtxH domain-containing protein [Bacillota bacterium]
MRNNFIKGMAAGAIIGATAGMMIMPRRDKNSKRRVRMSAGTFRSTAEDLYDNIIDWIK